MTDEKLIEILQKIKEKCLKTDCEYEGCPFFDEERYEKHGDEFCNFQNLMFHLAPTPDSWDINYIGSILIKIGMEKQNENIG